MALLVGTALKWTAPLYTLLVTDKPWDERLKALEWDLFLTWTKPEERTK